MKFMIVDDSDLMRQAIIQSVVHQEDTLLECEDGDQAIARYAEFLPDWVLMDLKMKRISGLTATREIKKNHPASRIAIVTSYDHEMYRKASEAAGADRFFSKKNLDKLGMALRQTQRGSS